MPVLVCIRLNKQLCLHTIGEAVSHIQSPDHWISCCAFQVDACSSHSVTHVVDCVLYDSVKIFFPFRAFIVNLDDMAPLARRPASPACTKLAKCLGFVQNLSTETAEPYIQYIIAKCPRSDKIQDFLWLFAEIVELVQGSPPNATPSPSIEAIISQFDNDVNNAYLVEYVAPSRRDRVTETVFTVLGLWSLTRPSFVTDTDKIRPVIWAYDARINGQAPRIPPLTRSLAELIKGSGLIPASSSGHLRPQTIDSAEDPNTYYPMSIPAEALNLSKLATLAGIHVHWTDNIARHLLLSSHAGASYVELYAFPCMLRRSEEMYTPTGVTKAYINEVSKSYAILFRPRHTIATTHRVANWFGARRLFCWCLSCTSYRLTQLEFRAIQSERAQYAGIIFDPVLHEVSGDKRTDWSQGSYPNLWARVMALQAALQDAKPWSFWVLFRDRREKLPFWTFL